MQPEYAGRDYRRAYLVTDRLLREHPDSPYGAEARAWLDLLEAYLDRKQELQWRGDEIGMQVRRARLVAGAIPIEACDLVP